MKIKKRVLSMAVAAALVGGVSTAQAVYVNADGLGEALIYPFYSVEGGNDTLISITNTTSAVKAVKVRVLEGMNSQEVLDFNLYLSPEDMWTAAITRNPNGEGAILITNDTSCTVPAIPAGGVAFRNFQYQQDAAAFRGVDRTREGYIEVLEMGEITGNPTQGTVNLRTAAIHGPDGVPANCGAIRAAWGVGGTWANQPSAGMSAAAGGLYGAGILINVAEGTNASYDAVALDNVFSIVQHTNPGSVLPSLANANDFADVIAGNQVFSLDFEDAIDAVSAVLMRDTISNDYTVEAALTAGTDWVVTFPTKRFYTNGIFTENAQGQLVSDFVNPFTAGWNRSTATACEAIGIELFDREERRPGDAELDFSPLPPGVPPKSLCREVNVVTFENSDVLFASDRIRLNLDTEGFENGWARFTLSGSGRYIEAEDGTVLNGLPVVGFGVQKYVNGDLGGLLSNYAGLLNHKSTRSIVQD
jgi:hypothetical protein